MKAGTIVGIIINVLVLLVSLFASKYCAAQDLALNKPYTLSVLPNYPYTAPSSDKTSLTDGIYTKGYFWAKATTVGWTRRQVTITIDLGSVQPVGAVTFNSVRRSDQNVDFPQNIYVFLSRDNKLFRYVGDAAKDSNMKGPYLVRKFQLDNINLYARYVTLVVFPQGNNLFCDEIEVLKGIGVSKNENNSIAVTDLQLAIDSLKDLDFLEKNIEARAAQLRVLNNGKSDDQIHNLIASSEANHNADDLNKISNRINKLHANLLVEQFKTPFVVEKSNPWAPVEPLHDPSSSDEILNYNYLLPQNGMQYGGFVITNTSQSSRVFNFSENPEKLGSLQLFEAAYVQSLNGKLVADPLVPVKSLAIDAGVSQLFVFKVVGNNVGKFRYQLTISSMNKTVQININVNTIDCRGLDSTNSINAVNWAYLSSPLLIKRKEQVSLDLKKHGINTVVVPPQFLSKPGSNDFTGLINYLSNLKFAQNILISTGYATPGNRDVDPAVKFLGDKWKSDFKEWYKHLLLALREGGFHSRIYFYPYDEVPNTSIGIFAELAKWATSEIPDLNIYATLSSKEAIDTIMPLIDIAQIQVPLNLEPPDPLPSHKCMVWIYSGSSPARALPPYGFYRLMSWVAFANDETGVGFWNYADEGQKQTNFISDPLLSPSSSYSVIYDGKNNEILSSRRWESFSLGIQDYSILKLYANKFGLENAKKLALKVIEHPENVSEADSVIVEMLRRL